VKSIGQNVADYYRALKAINEANVAYGDGIAAKLDRVPGIPHWLFVVDAWGASRMIHRDQLFRAL
jgi:hypothetical protein